MRAAQPALRSRSSAVLACVVFLFGITLAAVGEHSAHEQRAQMPAEDDVLFLPRADAIEVMSLGHRELAADLVYLRAVIYFGSEVTGRHSFRWLDNYLQTIVDLDPQWKTPYRWAGVATMYNGATITRERVLASSHFLRAGIEHFPSDWQMPFMLACNLLFEMKPKDAAEKAQLTAEGAEWMRRTALVGGAPPWAALLAATILRKEGREDAALRHLEQVYYNTTDERTRNEVRNRLISLKAKIDFDRDTAERTRLDAQWKRSMPYASPTLFLLVGPTPSADIDWRSLIADRLMASAAQ